MTRHAHIEGHCLCGAVKVVADAPNPTLVACHCDMCCRQAGGVSLSLLPGGDEMTVTGPVKTYASSAWAERAFCDTCGSRLWYRTLHDGARYLAAGLFENAGGGTLTLEYFADQCPRGYRLAGDHQRLSRDETIALFAKAPEGAA